MRALGISAGLALLSLTGGCATTAAESGPERGTVELSCLVNPDRTLSDCQVVREEPAGAGFGEAALQVAARSRVTPRTAEQSAGQRVRWTTQFRMAD